MNKIDLESVRSSNAKISTTFPPGLVAVFTGGTHGIGESTLLHFCQNTTKPRVYFVGRNELAADKIISEIKHIQPDAEATFIKKDLTLLKNVDEVCEEVKAKEKKINLLFMTQGKYSSLKGREETSEGLDRKLALNYYSRLRLTQQFLPLLNAGSPQLARVVSVLGPGEEAMSFDDNDMSLKHSFSLKSAANHACTMTDFAFEALAKENPNVSFVHVFPGAVKTGWLNPAAFSTRAAANLAWLVNTPWNVPVGESGERHLFAATSAIYPSKSGRGAGVNLGLESVTKGSAGEKGSGAYLISTWGEFRANEWALRELRKKGMGPKVLTHTLATFKAIRGS